jgi:hypothetical protein
MLNILIILMRERSEACDAARQNGVRRTRAPTEIESHLRLGPKTHKSFISLYLALIILILHLQRQDVDSIDFNPCPFYLFRETLPNYGKLLS